MHIPRASGPPAPHPGDATASGGSESQAASSPAVAQTRLLLDALLGRRHIFTNYSVVARRQTPLEETNMRTGIIVGVVLGVFLVATCAFLFVYRNSFKRKKRHRRHKSSSSKSSKSSDGGAPPPPPPED